MRVIVSFVFAGSNTNGAKAGPRKLLPIAFCVVQSMVPSVAKVGSVSGPGRSFETTLPYVGYSSVPVGRRGLPVSQ